LTKITPIVFILSAALIFIPVLSSAKTRASRNEDYPSSPSSLSSSTSSLEARLRPILEERVNFKRGINGGAKTASSALPGRNPSISQHDLFLMMKIWNSLSPDFKNLYAEATAIPKDYNNYVSPGGNFKIFYTTEGRDSVSSLDTVGYGVPEQPDKWREKRPGANGVPDYIDEAAFALDSAWSMEVERFGFPKPKNATDPTGSTAQYSVVIVKSYDYGVTYPLDKSSTTQAGFTSYIEINGNWSGRDWAGLGYNERPYDALRVTCAHEFFHSIQYSMVWTIDLDNLTYGWLEGSAVLMEELAFPDINDYLQYISNYFSNPRLSLLSNNEKYAYMNSIVLKYLYERAIPGGGDIRIVKAVQENNLAQKNITFHKNITMSVSDQTGQDWAAALNGFHAESYFTGTRARPGTFVSDAEVMDAWTTPTRATGTDTSANINSYAAGIFMYKPQADHGDTLTLLISGQRDAATSGATWGASAIVTDDGGDGARIVPITIDQNGNGRLELTDWKGGNECLLIATNAGQSTRRVTVKIASPGDTIIPPIDPPTPTDSVLYKALKISPNTVKLRESKPIRVYGGNITEVKIITTESKMSAYYNNGNRKNPSFVFVNDTINWFPDRKHQVPGVYFISASSTNPITGKKSTLRRKIMLLP